MLNIIFGIIIDTFGKLREDASDKETFLASFCFICGIAKDTFDSGSSNYFTSTKGSSYSVHIREEHNMWDYVFFLIYLQLKDQNEFTGAER